MAEANAVSVQEVRSYAFYGPAAAALEIIPEMKCDFVWLNPDGWWQSVAKLNDKNVVLVSNGVDIVATIPKDEDTSVKYKVTFLDADEVFKELLLRSYQYMNKARLVINSNPKTHEEKGYYDDITTNLLYGKQSVTYLKDKSTQQVFQFGYVEDVSIDANSLDYSLFVATFTTTKPIEYVDDDDLPDAADVRSDSPDLVIKSLDEFYELVGFKTE